MAKLGRPSKENKVTLTTLNVEVGVAKQIRIEAVKCNMLVQDLVTKILQQYLLR